MIHYTTLPWKMNGCNAYHCTDNVSETFLQITNNRTRNILCNFNSISTNLHGLPSEGFALELLSQGEGRVLDPVADGSLEGPRVTAV